MTTHSQYAPSAAHRWLNCSGNIRVLAARQTPDDGGSVFAREGSAAHELGAWSLKKGAPPRSWTGGDIDGFPVDEDMLAAVEIHTEYCAKIRNEAEWAGVEISVMIDKPTNTFGTADFMALCGDRLHVVDYKHGRGVSVSALDNEQLRMYGIGAVNQLPKKFPTPKWVELVIIQPRVAGEPAIRKEVISYLDLMIWRNEVLLPGFRACRDPQAPLVAGDWCRFCPAQAECHELHRYVLHAARKDFQEVPPGAETVTDDEIGTSLMDSEVISAWVSAVRAEASHRLDQGGSIPGWKLVAKRATRKWNNETAVSSILVGQGLNEDQFYKRSILSPAQIEKVIDKSGFKALADLIEKKSSGTTLVQDNDARPAARAGAAVDFDVVPNDEA